LATFRTYTDQELLTFLQKGQQGAFAEIYERYWALLLRHAIGMLQDEDEAKDVVQDVFYALWEKGMELNIHTSLSSFLYSSVRFRILKKIRHSKVAESYFSILQQEIEKGIPTTDYIIEEKELLKQIENGLSKLPPKMREVFELSRMHEYSHRQISEKLELSTHTVKRQVSNALKIMRESLNKGLFFFF
jgi:RNA polymerase sigma-70 factor (ECF subfamily)